MAFDRRQSARDRRNQRKQQRESRKDKKKKRGKDSPRRGVGGAASGKPAAPAPTAPAPDLAEDIPTSATVDGASFDLDDEAGSCTNVCQLADAICGLEARICSLADAHSGDPRYAEACARASNDCRVASDACTGCAP